MNQYEVMYVIDPTLEDGARVELINRFSELVKKAAKLIALTSGESVAWRTLSTTRPRVTTS